MDYSNDGKVFFQERARKPAMLNDKHLAVFGNKGCGAFIQLYFI